MRYRRLDENGDMVFGSGLADFLVDSPEAVAQSIKTRLGLHTGQWFLNRSEGTDWETRVLGKYTGDTRDLTIRSRILETPGVLRLESYGSSLFPNTREFDVSVVVDTIYGLAVVEGTV